ncbi:50S ribosomal protein L11 methyltransferase [Oceanospirillaceae bacterium]|jgi:ribosomal protein L11 methyltransferase|nr:50S ribosomal protein L11 methyltransferase [Oceanospirillaceae bacterium]MBT4998983.1 50S ribosomal protein L11 methyltransferase [Oceanospirillaceae bacterium]MBT6101769.1 50S ribosomal protein L11 methyltransferase [Oceanospirillaceae bacterium]MBT7674086.1 50S ribosomal protein L11 methyltransferase [Oceanospirillaceae bacterium]MDB0065466.1 50S ribosomal protein L11 methyltransferase [Oceanospirillaceae bacterium]
MPWVQLTLSSSPENSEFLEDMLLLCGAGAVSMLDGADQPVFEPIKGTTPLWQDTQVMGLFEADTDADALLDYLGNGWKATFANAPFPNYKLEILEDKDWERQWMDRFEPLKFGSRLWVCPSWKPVPDPMAVNLMLDPGLAFGTGSHPTTALCLQWIAEQDWQGKTVIDYGCGSGILAIGAMLMGAKRVLGVDNDTQALTATKDNAQRNGIAAQAIPVFLPENTPKEAVDVMLANILAGPLIDMAAHLAELTKARGLITLSGILEQQADAVVKAYSPWFDMHTVASKDEWVRIDGIKR